MWAPLLVDEGAGREPGQPAPRVAGQLADRPQRGEQLIVVGAGALELDACDHSRQQLPSGRGGAVDQEVDMPVARRAGDSLRALQIGAQAVQPDPPVDQPQDIGPGVVGFEHEAGEIDEPPHGRLRVSAAAPQEFLALSLRGPVRGAERLVEHLQRVVGGALKRLSAEAHQHRVAPLGRQPRDRLVGRLAASLRQPRSPVRWQS